MISLARGCLFGVLGVGLATAAWSAEPARWPSFRGPQAAGTSATPAPTTWNLESSANVRWTVPIPGLGHASPVVWGDHLFVVTAVAAAGEQALKVGLYGSPQAADDGGVQQWWLYALDRHSGNLAWRRLLHEGTPQVPRHAKASHANATPATDGKRVVVFLGSEGLHALDFEGNKLWRQDFGVLAGGSFRNAAFQWGFANSPVLHDGKAVVLADVQGQSFLMLLDATDGRPLWRVERDDVPTWGAPTIYHEGAKTRIAVNGFRHIGGYDFATGAEVWRLHGGGDVPIPTPVVGEDLLYIANAHGRLAPVYAIRKAARGDITLAEDAHANEGIAWADLRAGAYLQTPLLHDGLLYLCRDNGVLKVYDAASGKKHYEARLTTSGDGFSASPVVAGSAVYFTSEEGQVHVVATGTTFELLATNALGEIAMATPAVVDGTIYFRTRGHVVAVGSGDRSSALPRLEPAPAVP